jgi:DNA recombination protein RmuC
MDIFILFIPAALSAVGIILLSLLLKKQTGDSPESHRKFFHAEFQDLRQESSKAARDLREEVAAGQRASSEALVKTLSAIGTSQAERLDVVARRIKELTGSNESSMEKVRNTIDAQLKFLQETNEKKLEQMRLTVDEKLQTTLEKRLGESFKIVSGQLEAVQRGLGEMQSLAAGVGDLKRVLTNVKARGVWGEVQLGSLLEQMLAPNQYSKNIQTNPDSREMVEYAIRLPGPDNHPDACVWLPIDAKFPQEDYLRLLDAVEVCDTEAVKKATAGLVRAVNVSAKDIREKYLAPPQTTDFAIMFLPTEGLYAEVLRQPGQIEKIQQRYRIVVAGPTTLCAILNSLRVGFQTLALEKRSSEVWTILAAVKTEFGKFGDILTKVKKQLKAASNTIDQTTVRTRAMERTLRQVEGLSSKSATALFDNDNIELMEENTANKEP